MQTTQLITNPAVAKEVLRTYEVTLERLDLTDDDGSALTYEVTVPLRYSQAQADRRDPNGYDARSEAARRACKRERAEFGLDLDVPLHANPDNVRFVRAKLVDGRAK